MGVYRTKVFSRFTRKNKISDQALLTAAQDIRDGKYDADLGGGLYKQRVARDGSGKSGGFRTLITHRVSNHFFFVYGFGKNDADNVDAAEEKVLKKLAKVFGNFTQDQIEESVADGALVEIEEQGDEE
jgi:hypothetical protein